MISIIVAIAQNGAIGYKGDLIYHLSADLKRFKELTIGHTIIMGRRTFESLPKGALPNRRNIVLTRQKGVSYPGAEVYASIDEALSRCSRDEKVYIIGGAQVYAQALSMADELEITLVHDSPAQADTFFPEFGTDETWHLINREDHDPDEKNPYPYSFLTYRRR
ncbi:MAG: dihydrofolate reductase [Bacteroidaceae bacterium]|nr:dihydrofolate reductase [Bacteroidaceae bacterium]MBR5706128.1 dihydrofolate reductase [Bacteroidaceae bacterium]